MLILKIIFNLKPGTSLSVRYYVYCALMEYNLNFFAECIYLVINLGYIYISI